MKKIKVQVDDFFADLEDLENKVIADNKAARKRMEEEKFEAFLNADWEKQAQVCLGELELLNEKLYIPYINPREYTMQDVLALSKEEYEQNLAKYDAYVASLQPLKDRAKVVYNHFKKVNRADHYERQLKQKERIMSIVRI